MREILFRGKRVDNNQWTEGFLSFIYTDGRNSNGFIYTDKAQIYSPVEVRSHDVYTATVGQYTGLCDKNWVKIFEGDIIKLTIRDEDSCLGRTFQEIYSVRWDVRTKGYELYDGKEYCLGHPKDKYRPSISYLTYGATAPLIESVEIIGNIHDNPELLDGNQDDQPNP